MSSVVLRLAVVLAFAFGLYGLCSPAPAQAADASALESRLMAPCCWEQTLDVHQSPLAEQLRAEIRARLAAGESEAAIEADLIARYGERVSALRDPGVLGGAMLAIGAVGLATILGLAFAIRRWTRKGAERAREASPAPHEARDAEDDRLDDELAAM